MNGLHQRFSQGLRREQEAKVEKFPMIEKLGLQICSVHGSPELGVRAADLERVLSAGLEVRSSEFTGNTNWCISGNHGPNTGLLINIRPLKAADTAESLLREFINCAEGGWYEREKSLIERAKRLIK